MSAAPSTAPPEVAIAFVAMFAVMWVGIAAILSYIGGWGALSRLHPALGSESGKAFHFASMSLGRGMFPVNYNHCLTVRIGASGIGLSTPLPFRMFHPPIWIPWHAVSDCRREKWFLSTLTAVYLSSPTTRLLFRGRAARAIQDEYDVLRGIA